MAVRGVRGATTVTRNDRDEILDATKELLTRMVEVNNLDLEEIASAWLTTTSDVFAEFPAVAARQLGWTFIPLMQSHEMNVPGMLPRCIRVLLHVNTDKGPHDIIHVYQRGATVLRPDLAAQTAAPAPQR